MQFICKINKNILGKYKNKIITRDVILTQERLENHILLHHKKDYEQLKPYLKDIINNPDFIIDDNRHEDTIILLKEINEISKHGRIVLKLALGKNTVYSKNSIPVFYLINKQNGKNEQIFNKNSIITLMRLNKRTWNQTIKNREDIIFSKHIDKNE